MVGMLNRIIVFVSNPIRTATFYRDVFELEPIEPWTSDLAQLETGSARLAFHQAYDNDGPVGKPTGSAGDPHKIVFQVEDVAATRTLLISRGADLAEIRSEADVDGLVMCDGVDPEGCRFQICNQ